MATNTNSTAMDLVAQNPLVIFSKSNCCMCDTIKILFYGFGANPAIYELNELASGHQLERELVALGRRPCVPAVFIGGKLVGGSNEIMSLHVKGELVKMLKKYRIIYL